MRTNTIKAFKDFGVGRESHRAKIKDEIKHVVCEMNKYEGEPFDPSDLCSISICNVMCAIVFGKRYDYQDQDLLQLVNRFHEIFRLGGGVSVINVFPFLRYIPGDPLGSQRMKYLMEEIHSFVSALVQSHANSLDKDHPRDYIDIIISKSNLVQKDEVVLTGMYVFKKRRTFVCLSAFVSCGLRYFIHGCDGIYMCSGLNAFGLLLGSHTIDSYNPFEEGLVLICTCRIVLDE